jgi:hypothetical protein
VLTRRAQLARGEVDPSASSRRKQSAKSGARPTGRQAIEQDTDEATDDTPRTVAAREDALAGSTGSTPRVGAKPAHKRQGSRPSGNRPGGNRRR